MPNYNIAALADLHASDWSSVAAVVAGYTPSIGVYCGDIINDPASEVAANAQWDAHNTIASAIGATTNLTVAGNHEYIHLAGPLASWVAKVSNPVTLQSQGLWWKHEATDLLIIGLCANKAGIGAHTIAGEDQYSDLLNTLTSSTAKWKIVVIHPYIHGWAVEPGPWSLYYSNGGTGTWGTIGAAALNERTTLHTVFKEYGVNLVLNGHGHSYNRYMKDGVLYVSVPSGPSGNAISTVQRPTQQFVRAYTNSGGNNGSIVDAIAEEGFVLINTVGVEKMRIRMIDHYNTVHDDFVLYPYRLSDTRGTGSSRTVASARQIRT
jgi:hypothetical protein